MTKNPTEDDLAHETATSDDIAARLVVGRIVQKGGIPALIATLIEDADALEALQRQVQDQERLARAAYGFAGRLLNNPPEAPASPLTMRLLASLLRAQYPTPEN